MANETLIVPSNKQPTFWNKEAAIGFLLGGNLLGLVIGGFIGKNRMTDEAIQGKLIENPTIWNKSMVIFAALAANIVVAGIYTIGAITTPAVLGLLAATAVGAVIGGVSGKSEMEQEYTQAKEYAAKYGIYTPYGNILETQLDKNQSPSVSYKNSVSPAEYAKLQEKFSVERERNIPQAASGIGF